MRVLAAGAFCVNFSIRLLEFFFHESLNLQFGIHFIAHIVRLKSGLAFSFSNRKHKTNRKKECVKQKKWGKVQYYALISLTFSTDRSTNRKKQRNGNNVRSPLFGKHWLIKYQHSTIRIRIDATCFTQNSVFSFALIACPQTVHLDRKSYCEQTHSHTHNGWFAFFSNNSKFEKQNRFIVLDTCTHAPHAALSHQVAARSAQKKSNKQTAISI